MTSPGQGWGYTGIFAKENGGGFLTDHFPDRVQGDLGLPRAEVHLAAPARGRVHRHHPPGPVRHRAVTGAAGALELPRARPDRHRPRPDPRRSRCRRSRERGARRHGHRRRRWRAIGRDGARTVPARENGGNHDIKNFTSGSRVFYPVHVPGALFSGGDLHFSQGDGEITFCGAIEMGGFIDFHVDLIKGGMETYGVTNNPIFMPGNVEPRYSEFVTFIGIGVDHETDTHHYNDATVAYRNACLNAVDYLRSSATRRRRPTCCSAPRRSRAGSAGSSTSPTPAARCTCRPRSSTST